MKSQIFLKKKKVLRVLKQTGKRNDIVRDKSRKALLPGKRISLSGAIYWETRKNRSDRQSSKI